LGEGTLIHCWWGCILLHPPWKTARRHLKNWKWTYLDSRNTTPRDILKGLWVNLTTRAPVHPCLSQCYSHYQSYGNSQDAPPLMNWLTKCGTYIQWNFTHSQRKMKFYHEQVNGWYCRILREVMLASIIFISFFSIDIKLQLCFSQWYLNSEYRKGLIVKMCLSGVKNSCRHFSSYFYVRCLSLLVEFMWFRTVLKSTILFSGV
jgi:hypothetical protein